MKQILKMFAIWGSGCCFSLSAWVNTPCNHFEWDWITEVEVSAGYRQDELKWSIADPSGTPNILAELQWKDLQSWITKAEVKTLFFELVYGRASANYGEIFHGSNQDSNYTGDNKTLEIYKSTASSNKGELFDFSGGAGWQIGFCLCNLPLRFVPLIGYSYSEQQLRDHHGALAVNTAFSTLGSEIPLGALGSVDGLHSNYRGRWRGPWVGIDVYVPLCDCLELLGTFEYHRTKFHGTGHWNLRTDFIEDFQQKANHGRGIFASGALKYRCCCYSFGLTGTYSWMDSHHGTETAYFALGPVETRFNGAVWHSWSVLADAGYAF